MSPGDWAFAYAFVGAMVGTVVHVVQLERDAPDDHEAGALLASVLWPIVIVAFVVTLVRHRGCR